MNNSSLKIFARLIALFVLLFFSTIAFTEWTVDESTLSDDDKIKQKEVYIAEYGARELALSYLETHKPGKVKRVKYFKDGLVHIDDTEKRIAGNYKDVYISPVKDFKNSLSYLNDYYFDINTTGVCTSPIVNTHENKIVASEIASGSSIRMRVRLRTFSDYMYLTDIEESSLGTILWFWHRDVFNGRVHSNSQIGLKNSPTFYGPISTSAPEFYELNAIPYFAFPPVFNAPEIAIPSEATILRNAASEQSNFIDDDEGRFWTRLYCTEGAWECFQWRAGTAYDSLNGSASTVPIIANDPAGIFVDGDLYLWGEGLMNRITIGSSGNMWLCDDLVIDGFTPDSRLEIPLDNPNILSLISEKSILIKDSYPNGRNNSSGSPHYIDNTNITITAALVALGGSFSFEHHNNPGDNYIQCVGNLGPDERGDIILRGSVVQQRRGFLHRSTCSGTGYGKDYLYDFRLSETPPPYSIYATDTNGNAIVDIVNIEILK